MQERANRGYRPEEVNNVIATTVTWTGCVWMVIDTSFTISRAFDTFKPPNFFVRLAVACVFGVASFLSQKAVFEVLVSSSKREQWVMNSWNAGIIGRVFMGVMCAVVVYFIHFSFMATGNSIGISGGAMAIPNFGIKDLATTTTYLSSILAGIIGAFLDEMLFFFGRILKD